MTDKRYQAGIWVTVAYVVALTIYAYLQRGPVLDMTPNEFGDALAGAASPLAFLWLVLGYLQQGDELRQNTDALRLQAVELKNSVEQQAQLVETSKLQLKAEFDRHAEAIERETNALLPVFVVQFRKGDFNGENKRYMVEVRNVGAKCTGLVANISWKGPNGMELEVGAGGTHQEVGVVDSFGEFSIDLVHPDLAIEPRQITFHLRYYILQGGERSTVIPMEFFWASPGFMFMRQLQPRHVQGPSP